MRKCLITVDYQVDFVNGSLGFDGAEKLENVIAEKIEKYRAEGADIIFTLDTSLLREAYFFRRWCRHYIHSRYPSLRLLNYF